MKKRKYKIIVEPQYGVRRLEPLPKVDEMDYFYREQHHDLVLGSGVVK